MAMEPTKNNEQNGILLYEAMIDALQACEDNKHGFWTDGYMILSKSKEQIKAVANFFEDLGLSEVITGYYDPVEDEIDELVDEYTGCYYVTVE